jgi:hypothetical protein
MGKALDDDIRTRLTDFVTRLGARGLITPPEDASALVSVIMVLVDGVIANRARCPAFDPAPFVPRISAILRHGLGGHAHLQDTP